MVARGKRWANVAGILCADPAFRLYLDQRARAKFGLDVPDGKHTEADAADWIRKACEVASRKDIDGNPSAVKVLTGIRSRFEFWKRRSRKEPCRSTS